MTNLHMMSKFINSNEKEWLVSVIYGHFSHSEIWDPLLKRKSTMCMLHKRSTMSIMKEY